MRHSGPSVDLAMGHRTLQEVKLRGRWKADSSMIRYVKPGRVNEQMQLLDAPARNEALLAPARLPALLAWR